MNTACMLVRAPPVNTINDNSDITVTNPDGTGKPANGRSLMKVVALGVKKGHRLRFTAQVADAEQALKAIGDAIESRPTSSRADVWGAADRSAEPSEHDKTCWLRTLALDQRRRKMNAAPVRAVNRRRRTRETTGQLHAAGKGINVAKVLKEALGN